MLLVVTVCSFAIYWLEIDLTIGGVHLPTMEEEELEHLHKLNAKELGIAVVPEIGQAEAPERLREAERSGQLRGVAVTEESDGERKERGGLKESHSGGYGHMEEHMVTHMEGHMGGHMGHVHGEGEAMQMTLEWSTAVVLFVEEWDTSGSGAVFLASLLALCFIGVSWEWSIGRYERLQRETVHKSAHSAPSPREMFLLSASYLLRSALGRYPPTSLANIPFRSNL